MYKIMRKSSLGWMRYDDRAIAQDILRQLTQL